jgi:flavin reductase (DIM6/NTAB) family NADH-FMN oxidoreductase RutF
MKIDIGVQNGLYPTPVALVGTLVGELPNYSAIAHTGIIQYGDYLCVSINKKHYSNEGIQDCGTYSVNIPSASMVKETDYCGIVSGRKTSKADLFTTFYGELVSAPMIEECPINMECELIRTDDFPDHNLYIGKLIKTYCDDTCLIDNAIDMSKVNPLLFVYHGYVAGNSYWTVGERVAGAWQAGKELRNETPNDNL